VQGRQTDGMAPSPTSANDPSRVEFAATLTQAAGKSATGIEVPAEIIERLGAGKRPAVRVRLDDFEFRTTVGVMGGASMIPVSAAIRKEAGLTAGDAVTVGLVPDSSPRAIEMPDDFAAALAAQPSALAFYETLSNSLKRFHVDNINGAKTDETRARRIDKSVGLFLAGKPR